MADVSCVIKLLCEHLVAVFFKVNIHLITYAGEFDGQNAIEQSDLLVWMGDLPKINHLNKVNKNNGKSSFNKSFFSGDGDRNPHS